MHQDDDNTGGGVFLVRADDLSDQTPQTKGLQRFEAISASRLGSQDLWMGLSVLSGTARWWVGDELDSAREASPGDFVYIKPHIVHWEENASDTEPVRMIVARTTQDAIVINLEDHPFAPDDVLDGGTPHV